MRDPQNLRNLLKNIDPLHLVPVIEQGIKVEKRSLEAHSVLGNVAECERIKHRIADAEIFSLILTGDLPA